MKKTTINTFRKGSLIVFALLSYLHAYCSHIVGADLYYKHISADTYQVHLALYGDCGSTTGAYPTLAVATPEICVYDGSTYVATITLSLDTPACGTRVSPLCPGDTSQCTAITATTPGIQKFVYSGMYTLPHTSSAWRFIYTSNNGSTSASWSCPGTTVGSGTSFPSSAGRSAAITNISSAASTSIQLIDTLNNIVYSNTSPNLTVSQTTFFCAMAPDIYDPTGVDPDSDSLVYSLVGATNGPNTCSSVGGTVTYMTGLSGANPLQLYTGSLGFNTTTGQLNFNPSIQRSVVVYNIEEYRAGVLVGTSQREMTVLAVSCVGTFPCLITTAGVPEGILKTGVEIFPNPTNGLLTINIPAHKYSSLSISNTVGQTLMQQQAALSQTIDVTSFPEGLYYITLKGKQGVSTYKFVKN